MVCNLARCFKRLIVIILLTFASVEIYLLIREKETVIESSSLLIKTEFEHISYNLEPFTIPLPHFVDDQARDWFLNSTYYAMYSNQCPKNDCQAHGFLFDALDEHRSVHIDFVKNGVYANDDCGFRYGDTAVLRTFNATNHVDVLYDAAFIYTVPDGWSFQHFLDGVGPKLSHSYVYLYKYRDAKVLIQKGIRFDRSVKEIWEMLGVKESNRLIHYKADTKVGARLLINPCRTPATHPRLWQDARHMYWSLINLSELNVISSKKNLIFLQRTASNAMNKGRLILNEKLLIDSLVEYASKHSLNYIQYDHSKDHRHIRHQIELFYHAKIIIGVHGGAQSNMNFAPSGTTVIEVMPYRSQASRVPVVCQMPKSNKPEPCVGYIYYAQSCLLNQSYWILPTVVNNDGNINIDLTRVNAILNLLI
ncbi:unnamed protein product [Rotaria sp. Silwood1]|nr:unnamed protein product [Rotaria sp. Silwood1]CAF3663462.1 unnamed protein product [Rotaria sp. Silwood1]